MIGLGDGTISAFNIALWFPMIAVPAAVLLSAMLLRRKGRLGPATALLALLAVPGLLLGGVMLFVIVMFEMHPGSHH